jgi:hypothetical protein
MTSITHAESVMRSGLVLFVENARASRRVVGPVAPEIRAHYEAALATARAELVALIESVREVRATDPEPVRCSVIEIRTAHDLAELAADRRVPIGQVDELLRALEARDDDTEVVAILAGDDGSPMRGQPNVK